MSPPRNIQIFNQVVAVTLVKLYAAFPNPVDLRGSDVGVEAAEGFTQDVEEQFQLMLETATSSIGFLAHEGFLRYEPTSRTLDGPEFPAACLTLKGFTLLGAMPSAVDDSFEHRPFIEQLRDAAKAGAKASAATVVQSLFVGAIRLGVSAPGLG